jgi:hypothetical protein
MWLVRLKLPVSHVPAAGTCSVVPPLVLDTVHGLAERPRVQRPAVAHAAEVRDGHHLRPVPGRRTSPPPPLRCRGAWRAPPRGGHATIDATISGFPFRRMSCCCCCETRVCVCPGMRCMRMISLSLSSCMASSDAPGITGSGCLGDQGKILWIPFILCCTGRKSRGCRTRVDSRCQICWMIVPMHFT